MTRGFARPVLSAILVVTPRDGLIEIAVFDLARGVLVVRVECVVLSRPRTAVEHVPLAPRSTACQRSWMTSRRSSRWVLTGAADSTEVGAKLCQARPLCGSLPSKIESTLISLIPRSTT